MTTRKQLEPLLTKYGFSYIDEPGFISFGRIHPDGNEQFVRFVVWSNKAHAAKHGLPSAYLGVVVQEGRFRLPLVQWPSEEQKRLPMSHVLEELERVFLVLLGESEQSRATAFAGIDDRYTL